MDIIKNKCALCNFEGQTYTLDSTPDIYQCSCSLCGNYYIYDNEYNILKNDTKLESKKFKLACVAAERNLQGKSKFFLGKEHLRFEPEWLLKEGCRIYSTEEMVDEFPKAIELIPRAMLNLSRFAKWPNAYLDIRSPKLEYILFTPEENTPCMIQDLATLQYINYEYKYTIYNIRITPVGWQAIEQWRNSPVADSKQGFVAMWFDPSTDKYFADGICKAVEEAGYACKKINQVEHNNKICDEIIAEIRKSRFLIADFTAGQCNHCATCDTKTNCNDKIRPRGGVYFEAGFAMGLNIPVIWTVREDQINQIHFDTRQYNHVTYSSADELKDKLYNRIIATIGQGPINYEV